MGIFSNSKSGFESALASATATQEKYDRLKAAISEQVHGALAAAIQTHMEAQRALNAAEIAAATGEGETGEVTRAKKKLEQSRANIDAISAKLRALRIGQAELATTLVKAHERLDGEMAAYYAQVESEFRAKWNEAVKAFSAVLGERQALETLLRVKFSLADPQPSRIDIGRVGEPAARLRALRDSITTLAGWRNWHGENGMDGRPLAPLVPGAVYQLVRAQDDFEARAYVVESSFVGNTLRALVRSGDAVFADLGQNQPLEDAHNLLLDLSERDRLHDAEQRNAQERAKWQHDPSRQLDPTNPPPKPADERDKTWHPTLLREVANPPRPVVHRSEHERPGFQAPEPPMAPANVADQE